MSDANKALRVVENLLETDDDWPLKQEILQAAYRANYEDDLTLAIKEHIPGSRLGCGLDVHGTDTVCVIGFWSYWDPDERQDLIHEIAEFAQAWLQQHARLFFTQTVLTEPYTSGRSGMLTWHFNIILAAQAEEANKLKALFNR